MTRLLLTIRYIGTAYHGWQVQPNGMTIQRLLQDAIESVTGVRSGVIGCSRTDAGVHADMFCCTFDTESSLRDEKMAIALNAYLPKDVAVYGCKEVLPDFHPRYMAKGKQYEYRIWNGRQRNPFYEGQSIHISRHLNDQIMNQFAQQYCGTHDFISFCSVGSDVEDTVRTVTKCEVKRDGDLICFIVEANGFLYNMVRIMVGTLLDMESGHLSEDAIQKAFETGNRDQAGQTAPACGLFLKKVFY